MRYLFILMVILCTSCGTALPTVKPYKLDVQQGNVVTSKMLLQLRPGMTKSQVRFIMGTPLIQDSFHGNRWDYAYQMRENGKVTEQRRVILDFENELLKIVRGDVIPSETAKPVDGAARALKPDAKSGEENLMNNKLNLKENDEVKPPKVVAVASVPPSNDKPDDVKPKADAAMQVTANVAPVAEEVKSVLAVPVEAMLVAEPMAAAAPVSPEPAKLQKQVDAKIESSPELVPTTDSLPVPPTFYESSSGMLFDRNLRFAPEEIVEPVAKPVVVAPRAGNKALPKPKDLPAEGASGFFDRMLEKIGF